MSDQGSPTENLTSGERELVVETPMLPLTRADALAAAERREHPRLPLGLWAHCQIDGAVSQEALGDLSVGGVYLRTTNPVAFGAQVRIVLGLPYIGGQRVCSLSGRVVRIDRDDTGVRGVGVRFDQETGSADVELVRSFVSLWGMPKGSGGATG